MARAIYTTIIFSIRDILGISNSEYIFCDQVHKLSKDGWCKAKQTFLANNLGISDRGVRKMADRLIDLGLIEQGATGKYKTTDRWYKTAVLEEAEQSSTFEDRNKVPQEAEQSSSQKRNKVPQKAEQSSSTKENKYKTNFLKLKENKESDPDGVDDGGHHNTESEIDIEAIEKEKEKSCAKKEKSISNFDEQSEGVSKFDNPKEFFKNWEVWLRYKQSIKKQFKSAETEGIGISRLHDMSNGKTSMAIKIIETSIANGWQGLFELKEIIKPKEQETKIDLSDRTRYTKANAMDF